MNISPATLLSQYRTSIYSWPFIPSVETQYGLPRCLLVAVGSRETNMTNEVGDGGHGHGVWQYDDRSHTIPAGFDTDVARQATTAAAMLRGLIDYFQGNVRAACDAYNAGAGAVRQALNAGHDPDSVTTGRNYGADVIGRMDYLQSATSPPAPPRPTPAPQPPPEEVDEDMLLIDYNGATYLLHAGKIVHIAGEADRAGLWTDGIKTWMVKSPEQWASLTAAYGPVVG